jgi:GH25 family lysozyme M1 (1,4-beta-N-acetylmuramidase)
VVSAPKLPDDVPWRIWQFSGKGHVRGIKGLVDQNVFNGDLETFEAFIHSRRGVD